MTNGVIVFFRQMNVNKDDMKTIWFISQPQLNFRLVAFTK